jgi:hypothetical protein
VDFWISSTREVEQDYPLIGVQVKSWSLPRASNGFWSYRGLTEKQFNDLVGSKRRAPRFLFLVVVPADVRDYTYADDGMLQLRQAAYWVSLRDQQEYPSPSGERKVLVMVPQGNLLTVESFTRLCEGS